jgi:hypothetical protein
LRHLLIVVGFLIITIVVIGKMTKGEAHTKGG